MKQFDPFTDKTGRQSRTEFEQYRRYFCHICREECINHVDSAASKYSECRDCLRLPDLDQSTDRQAVDLPSGGAKASERSERPEDGQKPGSAAQRAARNVPRSEGSERSEVPVTTAAIGDAAIRLSHRRGDDE